MSIAAWLKIHPDFRLNGVKYDVDDLNEIGYSLIKEGESYEASIGEFLLDWISANPYLTVFTSGSTGTPKSIEIQKQSMINSAEATGEYFQLKAGTNALLCLPCTSIAGKMMLVRAMILGLQLDYVEPSSKPLDENQKHYDFAAMVPMQVQNSLKHLSRIKKLIIGGAPISAQLQNELYKQKSKVYETYGMTETVSHIAVKKLEKEIQYFEVLPKIRIELDKRGCLLISAPHLSETKVVTNDLVEIVDEKHFQWLGRYDTVINSGGIKLIPEQIESKLAEIIGDRFFVAGIPDETLGEQLVLVLERSHWDTEELYGKIRNLKTLDKYEVPKKIVCIPKFLETQSGKIQRAKTLSLMS